MASQTEKIRAVLAEEGNEISCAGMNLRESGCFAATLAKKIEAILPTEEAVATEIEVRKRADAHQKFGRELKVRDVLDFIDGAQVPTEAEIRWDFRNGVTMLTAHWEL